MSQFGPIGKLGLWSARHFKGVLLGWLLTLALLGAFAPGVENALSGAGWQANGSNSVLARGVLQRSFNGDTSSALQAVVHVDRGSIYAPSTQRLISKTEALLKANSRVSTVLGPRQGLSISQDSRTAVIQAFAKVGPNQMVRAADALKGPIAALSSKDVTVRLTGDSVLWSDFNQANRTAMMKSELISWPITLAILTVAFGSLVAAGLPLLIAILALASTAGLLDLATHLAPVSIWAMNFALMFALALGIDYALFVVVRFRAAHVGDGLPADISAAATMDTAGKAVVLSGLTVLVSLSAVLLVPSPAFRSMALGIMAAVVFVLAATVTLLPAVLAKLGKKINKFAIMPWVHSGEHRSPLFNSWAETLWAKPLRYGIPALVVLLALAYPVLGLRTAMPSIKVVPAASSARIGYELVQHAFGKGAPGTLQVLVRPQVLQSSLSKIKADSGIAEAFVASENARANWDLIEAIPKSSPSSLATGATIDRLRGELASSTLIGGAAAENHDLQVLLSSNTPKVIGLILALGFVILLIALRAPLAALLGVLTSLLSTGAAFGVARLVFQNGDGHGLLGFEPQGFLDAWGPIFFFAMIFAIAMDYTVFLLSSAKEHWERSGNAEEAMVGGLAHSGRVIIAAGAVMVAVFFTFAVSGPLPPKEMGIILGVAVFLDATLVRLVLLPILLRLAGPAAWWLPRWGHRILPDISFGHGELSPGHLGVQLATTTENS